MEIHYLIDYENDGKNALKGCEKLKSTDHIHLFYTDNSKNATLDIFTNHGDAELNIKKVPAGEQSLDKHLIAYLGYLVGKNTTRQTEYVIISSDKGYDKVGAFLCDECDSKITITRRSTIDAKSAPQKKETLQKTEKQSISTKVDSAKKTKLNQQIQKALSSSENKNKTLLHKEIQQILSRANVGKEVIAYVPGLVVKHYDEKNALQTIYREITKKFGQKKGLDIYNRIKKHI